MSEEEKKASIKVEKIKVKKEWKWRSKEGLSRNEKR